MIQTLIGLLPESKLKKTAISRRQDVPKIMNEVVESHKVFAKDYDKIAEKFWAGSVYKTAVKLFNFCKSEMIYQAESDKRQTSRSPAAILKTAKTWGVDCKHYAGFIGGVLDALKRQGYPINWAYRFVSYSPTDPMPEHVFIILQDGQSIIFVDPVLPGLDQRTPIYYYKTDKFVNMALNRINGFQGASISQRKKIGYAMINFDTAGGGGLSTQQMKLTDTVATPTIAPAIVQTMTAAATPAATKSNNNLLLLAGAAIALYLIVKK